MSINRYKDIILSDALLGPIEGSFGSVPMCSDCALNLSAAPTSIHHATQGDFVGEANLSLPLQRNNVHLRRLITLMRTTDEVRRIL